MKKWEVRSAKCEAAEMHDVPVAPLPAAFLREPSELVKKSRCAVYRRHPAGLNSSVCVDSCRQDAGGTRPYYIFHKPSDQQVERHIPRPVQESRVAVVVSRELPELDAHRYDQREGPSGELI